MKISFNDGKCRGEVGAFIASILCLVGLLAAPSSVQAEPCGTSVECSSSAEAYRLTYTITSTGPPAPVTNIINFYNLRNVITQGDFSLASPPTLPTGSGTLDAGFWRGTFSHYLLGVSGSDLVVMMSPGVAAQMIGRSFTEMIYGVNPVFPLPVPPPLPATVEALIIDAITTRAVEFNDDVGIYFNSNVFPNTLNPSVLVGPGVTNAAFTMMKFTDGVVIGTVSINVTAVPEPATWLSMLAGIGLLGSWRRAGRAGSA